MSQTGNDYYGPSWFAATRAGSTPHRVLVGSLDADVCIVGASLAGLTAARELARRGWSVAILEARHVGHASECHGLGLVAPGFSENLERVVARVGIAQAKALWALSSEGAGYVREAVMQLRMDGVEPIAGAIHVQRAADENATRRRVALLGEVGAEAEFWPGERVQTALHTTAYAQGIYRTDAFHIHPLNFVLGLAAAAEAAGARTFESARVTGIDAAGVRKRVYTESGEVRAAHIIIAAADPRGRLHPLLRGSTMTLARHMAATEPLGERFAAGFDFTGAVIQEGISGARYRLAGEGLLWASPSALAQSPRWGFSRLAARRIGRLHPPLRGVKMAETWAASANYAAHRMPLVGELAPNLWLAGALGDQAINTAAMAGNLIARAIGEKDDRWRLFSPYGLVWAGGAMGRAATRIALGVARARAVVEQVTAPRPAVPPSAAVIALAAEPIVAPTPVVAVEAEKAAEAERKRPRKKASVTETELASAAKPVRRRATPAPRDVVRPRAARAPKPAAATPKTNGHDHGVEPTEPGGG